ncbi:UNVERIFIED_CONTAM: hypothetical protein Slati_1134500, partial [Sesamum latifolium]
GWLAWLLIEGRNRLAVHSELARPQDRHHSRSLLEGGRRSLHAQRQGSLARSDLGDLVSWRPGRPCLEQVARSLAC